MPRIHKLGKRGADLVSTQKHLGWNFLSFSERLGQGAAFTQAEPSTGGSQDRQPLLPGSGGDHTGPRQSVWSWALRGLGLLHLAVVPSCCPHLLVLPQGSACLVTHLPPPTPDVQGAAPQPHLRAPQQLAGPHLLITDSHAKASFSKVCGSLTKEC